jgi:phosphoserine phosphatase
MSKFVLTLIAPPAKEKLTNSCVTAISSALSASGAVIIATEWLAADEACDIIFSKLELVAAEKIARNIIADSAIDCIAQETATRHKRMLISDMDSTIITIECIDEIADFAGVKAQVSDITERAMRGELDFIEALNERVMLLKDLPESVLQDVYKERVKFMPGARELVQTMRANGAYAILVSGGFEYFTSRVQEAMGFHSNAANILEVKDGKLTGKVVLPILDKNSKLQTLMQVAQEKNIPTSEVLAVGDGANDLPMLIAAGLGVAYHAKPIVQQSAAARLNHCDLTALLYAQGYKKEEFIS